MTRRCNTDTADFTVTSYWFLYDYIPPFTVKFQENLAAMQETNTIYPNDLRNS